MDTKRRRTIRKHTDLVVFQRSFCRGAFHAANSLQSGLIFP